MAMIWTEVKPCTPGGAQWEAYPNDLHAIDVCPHQTEGWVWFVITDDVDDNAPEGWSATVEDAKRQAEQAYLEWLDVTEGRKPIPDEWLDAHDETAEIVAAAVARERAAVVAWLREAGHSGALDVEVTGVPVSERERAILSRVVTMALCEAANLMDSGEHRRAEEP